MRKWLARLEGTIYWPHYEWQINSKPIEIKDVIAATISSYQQLLGVPVNKDFDVKVFAKRFGTVMLERLSRPLMCQTQIDKYILIN